MSTKIPVSVALLESFCFAVLTKAGLCKEKATTVTDSLLFADLRGVSSHGVARIASYLERVSAGVMALDPSMTIERDYPGSALLDAHNGLGQLAGTMAMALAVKKAKTNGVGLVGVKNSNHFGVAAFFAMQAVREDMIGLVTTNASPAIAPFRALTPLVGTNPLAVAIPAATQKPIVLDMSSSVVARGKIRLASLVGDKIPIGWALDAAGKPTEDAHAALKGSMEPIGGPKGAGLSLIIDLLCGALTGTALSGEVKNITDLSGPSKTGHIFIAIDISKFVNLDLFKKNIDEVIHRVKSLPSVEGSPIYLPGEIEWNLETKFKAAGIPLATDVLAKLGEVADTYGVARLPVAAARAVPRRGGGGRGKAEINLCLREPFLPEATLTVK